MRGQIEHDNQKTQKTGILNFYDFYRVFRCSVQSEVKTIILVKSSLREVRSNPRQLRFNEPMRNCSHLNFYTTEYNRDMIVL